MPFQKDYEVFIRDLRAEIVEIVGIEEVANPIWNQSFSVNLKEIGSVVRFLACQVLNYFEWGVARARGDEVG